MALEDGAVLGTLLGRLRFFLESRGSSSIIFPADPISGILQLYERLRKPRTTLIVQGAMRNRCVYHLPDGEEQEKRDAFFASVKDWDGVDAPMYTMIDSRYQRGLLGYASVAAAEKEFDTWCQSWAGKYGNLSARI
jgi:salicylate hydroxylase